MQHATVKLDRIYYIGRKRINHLQQSFPPKKLARKRGVADCYLFVDALWIAFLCGLHVNVSWFTLRMAQIFPFFARKAM